MSQGSKKAKEDFENRLREMAGAPQTQYYGAAFLFENPPTVKSLFKEMVTTNPYGDVKEMMDKANQVIELMNQKNLDKI